MKLMIEESMYSVIVEIYGRGETRGCSLVRSSVGECLGNMCRNDVVEE